MSTETSKRLFNVREYHRMVEAGILRREDRVELIHGEILAMSPIGPSHNGAVLRANNLIMPIVAGRAIVGAQTAVRLSDYDEPQPDIVLLRPRGDFYSVSHAGPGDILLTIEMADSSIAFDRTVKADLYAMSGIVEYWIADITEDCVWTHSNSDGIRYGDGRQFKRGEQIVPQLIPDCAIPVSALLP